MTAPAAAARRVLVIGVGNTYRGDDAAGLAVAEWIRAAAPPDVTVVRHEGEPISLLETWDQAREVYLVDAVSADGEPGNVYRFDLTAEPLAARLRPRGTHALGVADTIELARALGRLRAGSSATASRAAASPPGRVFRPRSARRSPWRRNACWPSSPRARRPSPPAEFRSPRAALSRAAGPDGGEPDPVQRRYRAPLAAGQSAGLGFTRYVRQPGPVTSASPADLAAAIGPSIRRHLTGELASG